MFSFKIRAQELRRAHELSQGGLGFLGLGFWVLGFGVMGLGFISSPEVPCAPKRIYIGGSSRHTT